MLLWSIKDYSSSGSRRRARVRGLIIMLACRLLFFPLDQSSVMTYGDNDIPEARFNYDISPMSVVVKKTGRR